MNAEPSRRQWVGFWSMIVQQTQNAFNDKMAQFVLIPLGAAVGCSILGASVEDAAGVMIALPFVLFAPLAGWVSDRYSKRDVMLGAAIAQLGILTWIALAVFFHQLTAALLGFFALAVQSAFFGPAKMGINKELVGSKHLGFATGIQQMTAMLAILVGQIVAGWWFDRRLTAMGGTVEVAWAAALGPLVLLALSALPALLLAWIIPRVPAQAKVPFSGMLAISHFVSLRDLWSDRPLRQASFGVAFFWGIAAFINLWSIKLAKHLTGGGEGFGSLSSGYMAAASLGMAGGFGFASFLLRKRIELGWVPVAGILMACFAMVIVWVPTGGVLFLIFLAALAFSSALFLAPLNAWMQDRYPAEKRGELQSAVNLQDCLAGIMAVAVMVFFEKMTSFWGWDPMFGIHGQMLFVSICCLVATFGIMRMLPADVIRVICTIGMRFLYRIRTNHAERVPMQGGVLLLPNHVSYADAFLLTVASPRPMRFVMDEIHARRPLVRLFTSVFDTLLIRRDQPLEAIREIIQALQQGEAVCFFPEGQLTRTGGLCPLQRGFELIARKAGHPILPVWVDGAWGSIFSYERNRFFTKMPYLGKLRVSVGFGEPIAPREATRKRLLQGMLEASADALSVSLDPARWGRREVGVWHAAGECFRQLDETDRWRFWLNGHQVRMTNALQPHVPIHVLREDPVWQEMPGLLVAFAKFARVEVKVRDWFTPVEDAVWVGGDVLRRHIEDERDGATVCFYDFGSEALQLLPGVEHYPCLAVDGRVIAMSMPSPLEIAAGYEPQHGKKPGTWGRLLPGWSVRADGRVHGPAAPEGGLLLPSGCSLDEECFLVKS